MKVYDSKHVQKIELPINEGSKRVYTLMGDDYITLKIKTSEPIDFARGDYVDSPDFGRFEIIDLPKPAFDIDDESYDYEVKFEAPYKKWRNRIFRFYPSSGGGEASWSLTDTISRHLDLVIANLKAEGIRDEYINADYQYVVLPDVSAEAKLITYNNTSILDALSNLAKTWETEFWLEGNVIYFGKCAKSNLPKLELDIRSNVESMSSSASQSDYATRIFAFGSERNIPNKYRKHLIFTVAQSGSEIYDIQRPLRADYFDSAVLKHYTAAISVNESAMAEYDGVNADYTLLSKSYKQKVLDKGVYTFDYSELTAFITVYNVDDSNPENFVKSIIIEAKCAENTSKGQYYFDSDGKPKYEKMTLDVPEDNSEIEVAVKLMLRIPVSASGKPRVSASFYGKIQITGDALPVVEGVVVKVVQSSETKPGGVVVRIINNCVFNPAMTTDIHKPIRLPQGETLAAGTKYVLEQVESKAPASYYTPNISSLATVEGVVQNRLMLPIETPYVDIEPNLSRNDVVEKVVVFEDIYPRMKLYVTDVKTIEKPYTDEYGGTHIDVYYRIKDNSFKFDRNWQIDEKDLHIVFQSGLLNGMDFEVHYNPDGLPPTDPDSEWFEITVNENYGRRLPDSILHPSNTTSNIIFDDSKVGDCFFLYNWDSSKIDQTGLIEQAEQELLEKTQKYIKEISVDPNTYSCVLNSDFAYHSGVDDAGDYHFLFRLGQQVNLYNKAYFNNIEGVRESRIMGYECSLDIPYDKPTLTIGDKPSYSLFGELKDSVENLTVRIESATRTSGGTSIPIIKTGETTPSTDFNVYSALRSQKEFLSKIKADRTPHALSVGGRLKAEAGAEFGEFLSGLFGGFGGAVDGKGNAEFESAVIRSALTVMELVINEMSVTQGDQLYSEGDTIDRCWPETDEDGNPALNADSTQRWWIELRPRHDGYVTGIRPGMVLRGMVNNLYQASVGGTAGSYYTSWMRVNGLEHGTQGNRLNVTLYPDDETPALRNYPPCELMTLGRWGHQTEREFQRLFKLSSHEGNFVRYEGVRKPVIDLGNIATFIGRYSGNWLDSVPSVQQDDEIVYAKNFIGNFIQMDHKGNPVPEYIDAGPWDPNREYLNEAWITDTDTGVKRFVTEYVRYCGCLWLCARNGVIGIAPGYGVTSWAFWQGNDTFEVDFEEKAVVYNLRQLDLFNATLTLTARMYNQDVLHHIKASGIQWTRESYDSNGALRAASDAAWTPVTNNDRKQLVLTKRDLGYDGTLISRITFTARVAIDDTHVEEVQMTFRKA